MRPTGLFLTAFLLATFCPLLGQQATFVGVVVDSLTGDPLAGAYVSMVGLERTVVTGIDGQFALRDLFFLYVVHFWDI